MVGVLRYAENKVISAMNVGLNDRDDAGSVQELSGFISNILVL